MLNTIIIKSFSFNNIKLKQEKPAMIKINLSFNPEYPSMFTSNTGRSTELIGYIDPETGLYVTNSTQTNQSTDFNIGVENKFRLYCKKQAFNAVKRKIDELHVLQSESPKYSKIYKDPDTVERQLCEYLDDEYDFYNQLRKQIKMIAVMPKPQPNEYILYQDDEIDKQHIFSTIRLPYQNPLNHHHDLTIRDIRHIEKILNVFFTKPNRDIFSWYMGAVFANKQISDKNISKMLIISSKRGGVGKSTLMQIIGSGLLHDEYMATANDFDSYFAQDNRFGTSTLPHNRLVVYSEAKFNGSNVKDPQHDFTGINDSQIKTLITEGRINSESKFKEQELQNYHNLHIVLTTFLPQIDNNRVDLTRRLIAINMKETTMPEKASKLSGKSTRELINYVDKNGQMFIDYFVKCYMENSGKYSNMTYDSNEANQDTNDDLAIIKKNKINEINKLRKLDGLQLIVYLYKANNYNDARSLINDCISIINGKTKNDNIRYDSQSEILYLNSSKTFMSSYTGLLNIRQDLRAIYTPDSKYRMRMFALPIKNKY